MPKSKYVSRETSNHYIQTYNQLKYYFNLNHAILYKHSKE